MGKIDDSIIQRVLDATDIVDVIGDFVELKKKGARYIGLCPFHDDRHATNFVVYPKKNCYRCFACDAKGDVVKFLMENQGMGFADAIRYLGKKAKIDVDGMDVNVEVKRREAPPPLPTLFIPDKMVRLREYKDYRNTCNFIKYLNGIPWPVQMRNKIEAALWAYHFGITKYGSAIFWQIDENGGVRDGKIMKYKRDGHRDKDNPYSISWVSSKLFRHGYYDENQWEVRRGLFGLHLLNKYPNAEVHIVESEKTAIFCTIYFGDMEHHIWMATAGKGNLTRDILKPLIDARRTIALHPDKDGMDDWKQRCHDIGYQRAYVNNAIMVLQWKPCDGEKADIADVLERELRERNNKAMKPADVLNTVPAIKTLIERFDLKEEKDNGKK